MCRHSNAAHTASAAVGCAWGTGSALGARRDGRVTVAAATAAEPQSLLNGGVLAHANTACSHSHQNMSFDACATRVLGATIGGAGAARGGDCGCICAGSECNTDMGGGVRDVARALLRAHG